MFYSHLRQRGAQKYVDRIKFIWKLHHTMIRPVIAVLNIYDQFKFKNQIGSNWALKLWVKLFSSLIWLFKPSKKGCKLALGSAKDWPKLICRLKAEVSKSSKIEHQDVKTEENSLKPKKGKTNEVTYNFLKLTFEAANCDKRLMVLPERASFRKTF